MDIQTTQRRVKLVRERMQAKRLDCLIVTCRENVTYLTGFLGHDSWVVIGRGVTLLTDSRYAEQAEQECIGCRIVERKGAIAKAAAKLVNRVKSIKVVGIEKSCTLATAEKIRKNLNARVKPIADIVENLRQIKDSDEVRAVRTAAEAAWEALGRTLIYLRAGMTESELAGILEMQIRKLGMQIAFDTIICFGPNGSQNHHQPGGRKLLKNDTILIDFGARYRGYCCDLARNICFGKPNKLYQEAHNVVRQAQKAAISKVCAGALPADVDAAAREVIEAESLPVHGHGTGHGLGLAVHEEPVLTKTAKGRLKAGQLITIEPGVYVPGKFGIRIEDDVLVTETGCEIISKDRNYGFSSERMTIVESR